MKMKGVIPAAGRGKRLRPYTRAVPKELLPVGDRAVIEHVIEGFKEAGITDITVVVGWKKNAILDYLGSGDRLGVNLTYVVQDERKGLGDAVLRARTTVGDGAFAVTTGDNFYYPRDFLGTLRRKHEAGGASCVIGVNESRDVTRQGIIDPDGERVNGVVEKPSPEEAPSDLGISALYTFEPEIFDAIENTEPGHGGEVQLTDAIGRLIDRGDKVLYERIPGEHIDVGTYKDLERANEAYVENGGL